MSTKQRRIVELIVKGFTYGEIGSEVGLTERTVRWHAERIAAELPMQGPAKAWSTRKRIRDNAERLLVA